MGSTVGLYLLLALAPLSYGLTCRSTEDGFKTTHCRDDQICCGSSKTECCADPRIQNVKFVLGMMLVPIIILVLACCVGVCLCYCCFRYLNNKRTSSQGVVYSKAATSEESGYHPQQVVFAPQAPYPPQPINPGSGVSPPVYADTTQPATGMYKPLSDQMKAV